MLSLLADVFMTAARRNTADHKTGRKTPYADRSIPTRIREERRYDRKWDSRAGLW